MSEQLSTKQSKKVFISYSWDSDEHKLWVRSFATRLRKDGIDVILDRWHAVPGDQLPRFMEEAVRESDFVLCICTPNYKERSDKRGGGVGYEGDVMTSEVFINRDHRKFIPVLRTGEWQYTGPVWLQGKYYIDLRDDPYSEQNYQDLLATLHNRREEPPPIGSDPAPKSENDHDDLNKSIIYSSQAGNILEAKNELIEDNFYFVNREIELSTLDPGKLYDSYWQCALVSAPTGYGKTRLMDRIVAKVKQDPNHQYKWNVCKIDLGNCGKAIETIVYISETLIGEKVPSDEKIESTLKNKVCKHILEEMSKPITEGKFRNVLLIFDAIETLDSPAREWLWSLMHDSVIGSYIDYEKGDSPFKLRFIFSGIEAETFWEEYLQWETAIVNQKLRPPKQLRLSAFDKLVIEDLIDRKAQENNIPVASSISNIAHSMQFLSGGHPQIVAAILNDLASKNFLGYKDFFKERREELIKKYVSRVADKILDSFSQPHTRKDIKTICVFRVIDLNTLRILSSKNLVSPQVNINFLGKLCENKILTLPNNIIPFYHDDIIRRIIYLDFAFGIEKDMEHVQKIHVCAKSLYRSFIKRETNHHSVHFFFAEWLYHALQISNFSNNDFFSEWSTLFPRHQISLPLADIKRTIRQQLEGDDEIKYLYRERFGLEDLSPLFQP